MSQKKLYMAVGLLAALILFSFSVFIVSEKEKALVLRLGQIVRADAVPGLHFKLPFIENVRKFDSRIITLDAEPEQYLTAEKKNVSVDTFVKWRVDDVATYYTSMGGDAARANMRLSQIIKQELRSQFGKRTIKDVISGERAQIMDILTTGTSQQAKDFGIQVVDVRIKRIDLPADVSSSVYRRMEAERAGVAKDLRSKGAETAEKIRADADRQRTVILAEAYGEAERIRGEGDAVASETYAQAYNKDRDFYSFYRTLLAYKSSFKGNNLMVLEPDSDFFKFFKEAETEKP
ncbi:MAG: membrane protease subunit HflC [Halothiobacillaceae bacterium]|nr:MAG: membrane protease subunit HflC [Halothiobacillaceae bacterium]